MKLEECCQLIAFLISRNKGVWEPHSWLNSQETPGEGLFVLNKIQEQKKKSKPVPHQPERQADENKPVKHRLDTSSVVGLA